MRPANLQRTLAAIATLAALSGCGTAVQRIEPGEARDLSGAWNDTDSRLVAQEMVRDMRGWLETYQLIERRRPTLMVGNVRNLAKEPISVEAFMADIERALSATRRVTFVAAGEQRGAVRDERRDQDFNASGETRKPMGNERGADYMLSGTISAIVDRGGWTEVRYYQIDLALIDVGDNAKVWLGQKKIKKSVRWPLVSDTAPVAEPERAPQRFSSQGANDETGKASRIRAWECTRPNPSALC